MDTKIAQFRYSMDYEVHLKCHFASLLIKRVVKENRVSKWFNNLF